MRPKNTLSTQCSAFWLDADIERCSFEILLLGATFETNESSNQLMTIKWSIPFYAPVTYDWENNVSWTWNIIFSIILDLDLLSFVTSWKIIFFLFVVFCNSFIDLGKLVFTQPIRHHRDFFDWYTYYITHLVVSSYLWVSRKIPLFLNCEYPESVRITIHLSK